MKQLRALLAALFAAVVLLPLASPQARAEEPGDAPLERFGACVRGGGQGSVLMLFDRSSSVRETDPTNARVSAAKYLVTQLASTLDDVPDSNVDIALAGFDHVYEKSLDWLPLTGSNVDRINADLDEYSNRSNGQETDYWNAVDGARKELAARTSDEGRSCALMVWFSDGEYVVTRRINEQRIQDWGGLKPYAPDEDLRSSESARAARDLGAQDMCRDGGVADQLRSMDIVTLGIGLAVDVDPSAFDLMRGFATGENCGNITEPKPGEFAMASDVDDLLFAFDKVLRGEEEPEDTGVCVNDECPEGTRVFVLDGSIGKVQGLAAVPIDDARILVRSRSGETLELARDKNSATISGANVTWDWLSDRTLSLKLEREGTSDDWVGPWGLVFVAPTATDELARSTLRLYGDVQPVWLNRDVEARVGGESPELRFGLVNSEGNEIDPATLSDEAFMDVAVIGADGKAREVAKRLPREKMGEPLTLDLADLPPGPAQLWVTMDITTQSWQGEGGPVPGTKLEVTRTAFPLSVQPPTQYPTIADRVSFGSTETEDPVTVTVPLNGEGCVWLGEETRFTGYPAGLDSATLTSPAKDEASCSTSGLELTLDPGDVGNGALVGKTQVFLKGSTPGEPIAVNLDFDLQMSRPVSQPVLWGTLVGVTLLGIAIPVGILYLTKFLTATIPGNAVLAGRVTGPVDESRAFTDGGVNLSVADMQIAHLANNRRRVEVAGTTLKARMGLAPTEPGYVVVEQPGRAAGGRTTMSSVGDRAKLPLAVQGNWTVALDPNNPTTGDVTVTVFTGPGAPALDQLLDDVRSNIKDAVAKLRDGLPPDAQPAQPDPWGGGGGSSGGPGGPGGGGSDPWSTPPSAPPTSGWDTPPRPPTPPTPPGTGGQPPGFGGPPTNPPTGNPGQQWQQPPSPGGWNNPPSTGGNAGAGW